MFDCLSPTQRGGNWILLNTRIVFITPSQWHGLGRAVNCSAIIWGSKSHSICMCYSLCCFAFSSLWLEKYASVPMCYYFRVNTISPFFCMNCTISSKRHQQQAQRKTKLEDCFCFLCKEIDRRLFYHSRNYFERLTVKPEGKSGQEARWLTSSLSWWEIIHVISFSHMCRHMVSVEVSLRVGELGEGLLRLLQ